MNPIDQPTSFYTSVSSEEWAEHFKQIHHFEIDDPHHREKCSITITQDPGLLSRVSCIFLGACSIAAGGVMIARSIKKSTWSQLGHDVRIGVGLVAGGIMGFAMGVLDPVQAPKRFV